MEVYPLIGRFHHDFLAEALREHVENLIASVEHTDALFLVLDHRSTIETGHIKAIFLLSVLQGSQPSFVEIRKRVPGLERVRGLAVALPE